MMNFIRRRLKFLMWVVAAGFIGGLFFFGGRRVGPSWIASIMPSWMLVSMPGCARSAGIIMKVGDYNVGSEEFKRVRQNIIEIARWRYKDNFEAYAGNMDFDKQTIDNIIRYAVLLQEAEKQNIYVSEEELQKAIREFPYWVPDEVAARVNLYPYYAISRTSDGKFNTTAYRRVLESRGKVTPDQFSREVENGLLITKLKNLLTESAMVTDFEIQQEYMKRNEKAKIKFVEIPFRDFTDKVQYTEAEVNDYFEKNMLDYKIGERVNISFVKIDPKDFESEVTITNAEVASCYKAHQEEYSEPEKVKARHIVVRIDANASEEEKAKAKAYAEEILKEAKKPNADFAKLETKYNKEPFTVKHEDLSYFERGRMVKPFEDAAFALSPGDVSDVVETRYGYHIIKVEDKQAPKVTSLDEAKDEIVKRLTEEQSVILARQKADDIQYTIMSEESLQSAVDANPELNLKVLETGFFARGEYIPKIGSNYVYRDIVDEAFKLKVGEISALKEIKSYGDRVVGYFIFKLISKKPGVLPELSEVKSKVIRDLKNEKAKNLAMEEAKRIMSTQNSSDNLDQIAKKNGLEVYESQQFAFSDGGYIKAEKSTINSKQVMLEAFKLNVGEIAGPYEGRSGFYIIQMVDREVPDITKLTQDENQMKNLREQIIRQKEQKVYETWYQKIKSNTLIRSFIPSLEVS